MEYTTNRSIHATQATLISQERLKAPHMHTAKFSSTSSLVALLAHVYNEQVFNFICLCVWPRQVLSQSFF